MIPSTEYPEPKTILHSEYRSVIGWLTEGYLDACAGFPPYDFDEKTAWHICMHAAREHVMNVDQRNFLYHQAQLRAIITKDCPGCQWGDCDPNSYEIEQCWLRKERKWYDDMYNAAMMDAKW